MFLSTNGGRIGNDGKPGRAWALSPTSLLKEDATMPFARAVLRTTAGLAMLLLLCQQSYAGRAYAQSSWLADGVDFGEFGWFCGAGGTWTLGENKVKVNGITIDAAGPVSGSYPASDVVVAHGDFGKATGTAYSSLLSYTGLGPPYIPCTTYNLYLSASADQGGLFGERYASAEALGSDPQFVLFPYLPGVVSQKLSVDIGSAIFAEVPGVDQANAYFAFTAFDLVDPLAAVTVFTADDGIVYAEVVFNEDPRLSFLDPDTLTPITAADVKARLEGSTLGTAGGLADPLSLFIYQYDLSGTALPPDGAPFGCQAMNSASASLGNP